MNQQWPITSGQKSPFDPMPDQDWLITPKKQSEFGSIFDQLDVYGLGYITGEQARNYFDVLGLYRIDLGQIWHLADTQSRGKLSRDEFAVAMYLIQQQSNLGIHKLPETLPPKLIPPSLRTESESSQPRLRKLLSLDGGGVRGLSSLMVLQQLMSTIDPASPPKPCEYFDMIGGTSTGGLIAIMLGRLRMTVEECIEAYTSLSDKVFEKKNHRVSVTGRIQGRFDAVALEQAVKQILVNCGLSEDALLKDSPDAACKVFVCATSKQTSDTVCFTSFPSPRGGAHLLNATKIWEACRATSAATTFFDHIAIGPYDEEFVDGALGANNPVYALWSQAQDLWGGDRVQDKPKCLVSIGTGVPSLSPFPNDVLHIGNALIAIATETEKTAEQFRRDKSNLDNEGRYYRFNVVRGLEDVGLEESKKKKEIAAATGKYIMSQDVFKQMKACANNLAE